MKNLMIRVNTAVALVMAWLWAFAVPAFAATPVTGDNRGGIINILIGVMVVAVILIVVFAVMGAKKGGKGKK